MASANSLDWIREHLRHVGDEVLEVGSRRYKDHAFLDLKGFFASARPSVRVTGCDLLPGDNVDVVVDLTGGPREVARALGGRRFDVVLVTNYLWRPLWPTLLDSVGEGGWLVYETFCRGNETVGRPSNPDFLLRPGELLEVLRAPDAGAWRVIAYEDGFLGEPDRFVQRIAARRMAADAAVSPRHRL